MTGGRPPRPRLKTWSSLGQLGRVPSECSAPGTCCARVRWWPTGRGEIRAYEDRCPHLGFQLSEGDLDGRTLTCANHQWEFDALTGVGTNPGNCQLTAFGTRVRDGQIEILVPDPE